MKTTRELEQSLRERLMISGSTAGASGGDSTLMLCEESVTILEAQRQATEDLQAEFIETQETRNWIGSVPSSIIGLSD